MGTIIDKNKITLLFDTFGEESKNLYESFCNLGIDFNAVCMEDEGYLPDGVMSPYQFFLGDFSTVETISGKPRYFNQIDVPDYWEISGSNSSGKISDMGKERARIYYIEPSPNRRVRIVDWLDDAGFVRLSEHYNRFGALFCRTAFNKKGQKACRSYLDIHGREAIYENFVTGDILVHWNGRDKILHSKTELTQYYLTCSGLDQTRLFFNSLSYPFFVSFGLPGNDDHCKDALFWNEPIGNEIPGNMKVILEGNAARTHTIFVQRPDAYQKMISMGYSPEIVKQLGYIYSFKRENQHRSDALICTNSDHIEQLTMLVSKLSQVHFHICALTEMSSKLMDFDQYENVTLYPSVKSQVIDDLFELCDFYLDVNHEAQIVDAVHRAFMNNMLILGFEETAHNKRYVAPMNLFPSSEAEIMIQAVSTCVANEDVMKAALTNQKEAAYATDLSSYQKYFT